MPVFNQSRSNHYPPDLWRGLPGLFSFSCLIFRYFRQSIRKWHLKMPCFRNAFIQNRGIIYDRHGKAILNNTIMYDLMVTPSQVRNIDTNYFCELLDIDTAEFRSRLLDARFKNGPFRPTIFEDLLPPELYAKLEENIWRFPGFNLQERPIRHVSLQRRCPYHGICWRSGLQYHPGDTIMDINWVTTWEEVALSNPMSRVLMGRRGIRIPWIKDNKKSPCRAL